MKNNVEACIKAAFSEEHANQTINIGNNQETSVLDLAKLIIELTNSNSKLVFLPPLPEGDMTRRHPDITKMKELLGKTPLLTLKEGISEILKDTSYILS